MASELYRRDVLKGSGALVVSFALLRCAPEAATPSATATALPLGPYGPPEDEIDSWIAVAEDGSVTLFTGCCELGTGSSTGLLQIMAEELDIPFASARHYGPDTSRTPDQFVSSGSRTISVHGRPIRQAAAEARAALVAMAAERLGAAPEALATGDGAVFLAADPATRVAYAELVGGRRFEMKVAGDIAPKDPSQYKIVGQPVRRIDTPDKVFGTFTYMQDVRVPGMLHGRVVRPPSHGATLISVDESSVTALPGFVKIVRIADFLGVVCEREEQAIAAARALKAEWSEWAELPAMGDLAAALRAAPEFADGYSSRPDRPPVPGGVLADDGDVDAALGQAARQLAVTYTTPYHHHGSIGPSCALADVRADGVTVWSGSQTPYGLREAIAKFLGVENNFVRLVYAEASGCYGQNGADDVTLDAVIMSRDVRAPVRVQWMRHDENGWESLKSARLYDCRGGLDATGKIVAWEQRTRGFSGYSRPQYHEPAHGGEPGSLVSAQLAGWTEPGLEEGFGGAAGNFHPVYEDIPNRRIQFTYLGPASHREGSIRIRTGSMRGVGSPDNIFAVESFMDELAAAAGADALEFRLRHAPNARMREVFSAAAERANWQARPSASTVAAGEIMRGRGIAALGLEDDTYVVGIFEVAVNRGTGAVRVERAVVAQDCGLVVNPATVTDQIEGGVIMNLSRVLKEQVKFDSACITSLDWAAYPIIHFPEIPGAVEVILLDRPEAPPSRVGEPASEVVWPAMANAIFDATGVRLRDMPFTPDKVLAGLAEQA